MRNDVFLITYVVLQAHWALGAIVAYFCGTLTQSQYRSLGAKKAMGYLRHQGMWSDVYSLHPYLALMAAVLWYAWAIVPVWLWIILYVIAIILGRIIQKNWSSNKEVIESHNEMEARIGQAPEATGRPSPVGWVHVPHIAIIMVLGIGILTASCTGYVAWRLIVAGVLIFIGHACAGQHWILRIMDPPDNPWPKTENDGKNAILNIVCTSLGFFFVFWQFVVSNPA